MDDGSNHTLDNKLKEILDTHANKMRGYALRQQQADTIVGYPIAWDTEAIAAIKRSFLEMESMQDEELVSNGTTITLGKMDTPKVYRNEVRQAIRKEVEGE